MCKGEYSVGLAERYPNKKTLLELILKALVFGAKTAVETGLHNVALFVPKSN
jgi:hypothetical protein